MKEITPDDHLTKDELRRLWPGGPASLDGHVSKTVAVKV